MLPLSPLSWSLAFSQAAMSSGKDQRPTEFWVCDEHIIIYSVSLFSRMASGAVIRLSKGLAPRRLRNLSLR